MFKQYYVRKQELVYFHCFVAALCNVTSVLLEVFVIFLLISSHWYSLCESVSCRQAELAWGGFNMHTSSIELFS